ncbi:MAG TPA: SMI1/KNR4 family protein [Drouetiella sp.]
MERRKTGIDLYKALVKQLMDANYIADQNQVVPCTDEDIVELERRFRVSLPSEYKSFLKVMGREAGDFLNDGGWRYPLNWIVRGVTCLLEDNQSSFRLSATEFAFLHRDNFFLYFDTVSGDDPPVRIFMDGEKQPRDFFPSFSKWLTVVVEGEVAISNESNRLRQLRLERAQTEPEGLKESELE